MNTLGFMQSIQIAGGTSVSIGVWFKMFRAAHSASTPFEVSLLIDGVKVKTQSEYMQGVWTQLSLDGYVLGSGASHTFGILIGTQGATGQVVAWDDHSLTYTPVDSCAPAQIAAVSSSSSGDIPSPSSTIASSSALFSDVASSSAVSSSILSECGVSELGLCKSCIFRCSFNKCSLIDCGVI